MSRIDRIVQAVYGSLWAIEPEKLDAILDFLQLRADGVRFSADEIQARIGDRRTPTGGQGATAVLPLFGVVGHRMSAMDDISGGTSTERFAAEFDAAVDNPDIARIVLDVDSPGGTVAGVDELSRRIYDARGSKPIIAVANSTMASAAYWIASSADEVVAIPSATVGSIGVFGVHTDRSGADAKAGLKRTLVKAGKFKAEGSPFEPLSEEDQEAMQEQVDEVYGMFVDAVARNRGISASAVRTGYGEGRAVTAQKAKSLGMVDRIATLEDVLGRPQPAPPRAASRRRLAQAADIRTRVAAVATPAEEAA